MRTEPQLTKEFSKDQGFETYLSLLNDSLHEAEKQLYKNYAEKYPTVHVIGVPRSGTTLVTQMLSSFLDIGYINNLIAAFWKAPLFGIELSKKLLGTHYTSNFSSSFGRTDSIYEPHEFGYFWNYHLSYNDFQQKDISHEKNIDWKNLMLILTNMTYAFKKPVLFKSFLVGFHAEHFHKILPKSCFIYIRRNFINNAVSIYNLRKKMLGDVNLWASIKPKQYEQLKHENIFNQITGQILYLECEYLQQLKNVPESNKLIVSYEEVCNNPKDFLTAVKSMIEKQDVSCMIEGTSMPVFSNSENVNTADAGIIESFQKSVNNFK
ncbi:MAG TPA: sulfotransferase [Parafilimonas sp.]|nr:sulfotransferase [Parafilimonas sp.]